MSLVAPLGPAYASAATAVPATRGSNLTADQVAQTRALESGERVEVPGERSERDTVFANPDGVTFTLEKSITPVRVATSEGGWAAPDATLVKRADGSVGPKAAAVDVDFSPGGDGKGLVTIAEGGQSVSLGWPGKLPAPRLDGERAIYENVLPDVNLIMTATVEGFRQVLEVETPEAAANPALSTLDYALDSKNLEVQEGAGGGVDALDGNGQVVFSSPAAQMWNSAGEAAAAPVPSAPGETSSGTSAQSYAAAVLAEDPAPVAVAPVEEGDPLAGPGAGDESAVLDIAVADGTVTVKPDTDLLIGTKADEFPLYIDPSIELNDDERTVLSSDGDKFYNFSGGENGMSVGKCGIGVVNGVSYYCGSGYVNRMYFEFKPDKLKGKHILDATFRVTETWSFSCDARWVDLERTNNISSATEWPGPTKLDQMGDRNVSAGRGGHCSPSQPRAPIEFNDNAEESDENLTPTVRDFAAGKISRLTLMLMAKDESDTVSWKRFDDDAVLSVDYVGKPAKPTSIGVVTGSSQTCETDASDPVVVTDPTPTLTATAQTAPGGEAGAKLRIAMDVEKKQNGNWVNGISEIERPTTGYVGDNVKVPATTPTLTDNVFYRYRAWTRSFYGSDWLSGPSNASTTGWCYFKIDSKAPKPPTITFNGPYTPCTTNDCAAHGKPGMAGHFTLGPATGDVNTAYKYRLSTEFAWSDEKPGTTAHIFPIPETSGTIRLYARAKDTYGWGAQNVVEFVVREGSGPVGSWNFHEASGAAIDSSTTDPTLRDNATLSASAARTESGRRGETASGTDRGLRLDGSTAYAATSGQVIDSRASYTVAAWVRLDKATSNHTVLGQNGVNRSPFLLSYEHALGKWSFRAVETDTPIGSPSTVKSVSSKNPAALGVWTHLTGVYNAEANTLSLYVNGTLQGTTAYTTPWAATGALQIGRVLWSGAYTDYFPGVIDEVAVWQEARIGTQIAEHTALRDTDGKAYAELVAAFNPAGAQGTTLTDTVSGYGKKLALSSGATLNGEELVLDGSSGAGTTAGPLVDDSGSFTVTTEALVDKAKVSSKPDGYKAQILGQRTATGSSWSLWFEKTGTTEELVLDDNDDPVLDENGNPHVKKVAVGRWNFGRLTTDSSGTSVASDEYALLGSETRLTGVYDAQARTISLYLTADQQGTDLAYTAAVGSGDFAAGKGYLNSAWGNYLPGRISDIRLWAGALSDSNQIDAVVGT
ncbi:laminin G domain-containing protein [Streptomyces sp. ISL-99]|nr:laminin G domain-containing protein [Streptomyces sp. ISL-99]